MRGLSIGDSQGILRGAYKRLLFTAVRDSSDQSSNYMFVVVQELELDKLSEWLKLQAKQKNTRKKLT